MTCVTCNKAHQVHTDFTLPWGRIRQAVIPRDPDQAFQGRLAACARQPVVRKRPGRWLLGLHAPPCKRMADSYYGKTTPDSLLALLTAPPCTPPCGRMWRQSHTATSRAARHAYHQVQMAGQSVELYKGSILLSVPVTSQPPGKGAEGRGADEQGCPCHCLLA